MMDILASSPLLTVMLVVALGTLFGIIPFGPLRFGAAGALFVGLAVGALDPRLGQNLALLQSLGLALFVYTVGVSTGAGFFRNLRRQLPLMACALVSILAAAGITVVVGSLLGILPAFQGGTFAGALTNTPALAAATARAGNDDPAVGYALAYPVGVTVAILGVALVLSRPWAGRSDPAPMAGRGLVDISVELSRTTPLDAIPGFNDHLVRLSYLSRDGATRVIAPDEELQPGDRVVVVGPEDAVLEATQYLGRRVNSHLAHDRSMVDYRRVLISEPNVAGRTIADLEIPARFNGIVTRVRRGDLDLLAADDLVVELGDRLRVVAPRGQLPAVSRYLGDSERRVSEVDALSLGIGIALGLAVGLISIPLPGGVTIALGAAAGPLVVGMVLGRLERTGPLVWGLPLSANLTIRQLGLLLFLAAVGLASGQAFAAQAFTSLGLRIVLTGLIVVTLSGALMVLLSRAVGISAARTAGGLAGFVGQPAILSYANGRVVDERVDAGYAALFALGIIAKIVIVQFIVG